MKKRKYYSSNDSLVPLKRLLIVLITTIAITGISFIDNLIWKIIMAVICTLAFMIVNCLYRKDIIHGTRAGREANAAITIILIIVGILIVSGIIKLVQWIDSWLLWIKVLVIIILLLGIIITFIFMIIAKRNSELTNKEETKEN